MKPRITHSGDPLHHVWLGSVRAGMVWPRDGGVRAGMVWPRDGGFRAAGPDLEPLAETFESEDAAVAALCKRLEERRVA